MRFYPLRWFILLFAAASLICALTSFALAAEATKSRDPGYRIGPGDVVEISVWKNPDLTRTVTVLPDGRISFPLLGPIPAAGKTVRALSVDLRKRLSRYAPDVDLSVIVVQVNSMLIYVIGKVQKPGRYVLNTNVTVMQALAIAGGLTPFAKSGQIKIFREGHGDKYLLFNYDEVSKGKKFKQNIFLRRGDLVVVP
jgi:polysaccharide export outer membrane protein